MLISVLRTIVPLIWGNIIAFILGVLPALEPLRDQLLGYGDLAVPAIAAILTAAWYTLWRWAEPRLPAWLTAVLLGSNKAPVYTANFDATAVESGEPDYLDHVHAVLYEEAADAEEESEEDAPKHLAE